jgi:hypothetical protein
VIGGHVQGVEHSPPVVVKGTSVRAGFRGVITRRRRRD